MKKLFIVLAVLFTIIGIIFTFLPLGTLAIIPVAPALFFAFLAFRKSAGKQKRISKLLLAVSTLTLIIIVGKELFVKDEVVADQQFEQKKAASEKEAKKELEEIEGLE